MPFEVWIRVGHRKRVLDRGAQWRNLTNTIEPLMCSGDAAFLSNYFDHFDISPAGVVAKYCDEYACAQALYNRMPSVFYLCNLSPSMQYVKLIF